jgi:hypothetical protein
MQPTQKESVYSLHTIAEWWPKRVVTLYSGIYQPLKDKDREDLERLCKLLGPVAPRLIDWAMTNWLRFAVQVKCDKWLRISHRPSTVFLLANYDIAIKMMYNAVLGSDNESDLWFMRQVDKRRYENAKHAAKLLCDKSFEQLAMIHAATTYEETRAIIEKLIGGDPFELKQTTEQ